MHVNNFAFLSLYSSPFPLVPLILSCPDVVLSEFQDFDLETSGDPSNPEAVLSSVTRLHGSPGMAHFNLHLLRHNKHPVQQFRLITFHFTPLLYIFPTITLKNQLETTGVLICSTLAVFATQIEKPLSPILDKVTTLCKAHRGLQVQLQPNGFKIP
jgi:hypothetical protein